MSEAAFFIQKTTMKKLTLTVHRYPIRKDVAMFTGNGVALLLLRMLWFRLCNNKALTAEGYTLTHEISDCTLRDLINSTKISVA